MSVTSSPEASDDAVFTNFQADLSIPPFGLKLRFLEIGEARESGLVCLRPRVAGPPVHVHAKQDERFEVHTGGLDVLVGRRWRSLEPGASVVIPRRTPHTYRNSADIPCVFEYQLNPGGGFSNMMREFADLAASGKLRGMSDWRSLVHLARVFVRYEDEVHSVRPPMFVMRTLSGIGGWIGLR